MLSSCFKKVILIFQYFNFYVLVPTLRKQPSKCQFISAFCKCSTANLSMIVTTSFTSLKTLVYLFQKSYLCCITYNTFGMLPDVLLSSCIYKRTISMYSYTASKTSIKVGTKGIYLHTGILTIIFTSSSCGLLFRRFLFFTI